MSRPPYVVTNCVARCRSLSPHLASTRPFFILHQSSSHPRRRLSYANSTIPLPTERLLVVRLFAFYSVIDYPQKEKWSGRFMSIRVELP